MISKFGITLMGIRDIAHKLAKFKWIDPLSIQMSMRLGIMQHV